MIYLDNAATTLVKPPRVISAVQRAMQTMASPGRGAHRPAMLAAETLYDCRAEAAELFRVPEPEQVVFTMNATHGLNLAIHSLAQPGMPVVVSGFEHNSVIRPLRTLGAELRVAGRRLFDPADTLERFERLLPGAALAVCTHVSNAFGYILPIDEIAALCRSRGVPLIVDASQSAGTLPVDFGTLGAAFIAMPGHKGLYGPQGTGLLLCAEPGRPLLQGGSGADSRLPLMPEHLPDRLEAGTHNVCGIAGLLEGLRYVREKRPSAILAHERGLLALAVQRLETLGLRLYAGEAQSGVLSFEAPGTDCEELAGALAEEGLCLRAGLHCAPLAHESAGTLERGTLRMSFSAFTAPEEVRAACGRIEETLSRFGNRGRSREKE